MAEKTLNLNLVIKKAALKVKAFDAQPVFAQSKRI